VQKLLLQAEKRFHDRVDAAKAKQGAKTKGGTGKSNEKAKIEEVILKGAGKAIESVVSIAVFLQKKPEYAIRLKVGAVSVVDDIEMRKDTSGVGQKKKEKDKGSKHTNGSAEPDKDGNEDAATATTDGQVESEESDEEGAFETSTTIQKGETRAKASGDVPMTDSRVRDISMLEVGITLKSILKYEQSMGRNADPGYSHLS
jgi:Rpp20 subunit of nuclear RNase MRP and P